MQDIVQNIPEEAKVLLMLSGGRDSFISACKLLENKTHNYYLYMVTYDNGCSYQSENAKVVAQRIIDRYGSNRAEYLGVHQIGPVLREFFLPYFNMTPEEQLKVYPGLTPSQYHCLICRTSMYLYSIALCKKYNIGILAEGGRKSQLFVIEQEGFARDRYPKLAEHFGLQMEFPVYYMTDDYQRDTELMQRRFISKCMEAKCLIGTPMNGPATPEMIDGVQKYYDNSMCSRFDDIVDRLTTFVCTGTDYDKLGK